MYGVAQSQTRLKRLSSSSSIDIIKIDSLTFNELLTSQYVGSDLMMMFVNNSFSNDMNIGEYILLHVKKIYRHSNCSTNVC